MLKSSNRAFIIVGFGLVLLVSAIVLDHVATAQSQSNGDKTVIGADTNVSLSPAEPDEAKNVKADASSSGSPVPEPAAAAPDRLVSIVGRALDEKDLGRPNAAITLSEADGRSQIAITDKLGNFRFDKIADGQQVVLNAGEASDGEGKLSLRLAGETRVFWRTPESKPQTKNGE